MAALQERYGLSQEQVLRRLAAQGEALIQYEALKEALAEGYAGAWFDDDLLGLVVAISDPGLGESVLAAGAHPVVVERSLAELQAISDQLLDVLVDDDWLEAVTGWYIDYPTNSVVLEVLSDSWEFVASSLHELTVDLSFIRLEPSPGHGRILADVLGGDPYTNVTEGIGPCSIGFSVEGGYITATHCGWDDHAVTGFNGQPQGNFAGSTYPPTIWCEPEIGQCWTDPNKDLAWVSASSGWTPQPQINQYDGNYPVWVNGTSQPSVGSFVCRYGQKTGGPHCGRLQAYNQTVFLNDPRFGLIPFKEMIRTDVCAEGGDSGGPLVLTLWWNFHGNQIVRAVGTLTGGGSPGCPGSGGNHVTFFAPASSALQEFNLTLLTQ